MQVSGKPDSNSQRNRSKRKRSTSLGGSEGRFPGQGHPFLELKMGRRTFSQIEQKGKEKL